MPKLVEFWINRWRGNENSGRHIDFWLVQLNGGGAIFWLEKDNRWNVEEHKDLVPPDMVVHDCNPTTWEAEAGRYPGVQGQPECHSELIENCMGGPCIKKKKKHKKPQHFVPAAVPLSYPCTAFPKQCTVSVWRSKEMFTWFPWLCLQSQAQRHPVENKPWEILRIQ